MARILIVEDALMMRKTLEKMLSKAGHTIVGEATNGEQAVQAYKLHKPDLVTMDITMPGVDGIAALAQIIALDAEARVIMVSALGQKHKVFDALQNGAKSYILKPFQEERLLTVVNEVLGKCDVAGPLACGGKAGPDSGGDQPPGKTFLLENRNQSCHVAILKDFDCSDFAELVNLLPDQAEGQAECITFNFTCCNALNGVSAPGFTDVIASLLSKRRQVKIICYTRDYTMFFRNETCLKGAEFELVKKQGIL